MANHPAEAPRYGTVLRDISQSLGNTQEQKNENTVEIGAAAGVTGQITVTGNATLVRVRNQCRRGIKITNLGTVDVWISFSPSVSPLTGDLLAGVKGAFVVIPTLLDVYAICVAGSSQQVSFMEVSE